MGTSATEVEDMLKKLQSYDGVVGFVVMNDTGIIINTTFDNPTSVQYVGLVQQLIDESKKGLKEIDPDNDVMYLSLCSKKHEIRVLLEDHYNMIVVHRSTGSRPPI